MREPPGLAGRSAFLSLASPRMVGDPPRTQTGRPVKDLAASKISQCAANSPFPALSIAYSKYAMFTFDLFRVCLA